MSDQTSPVLEPPGEALARLYRDHRLWLARVLRRRFRAIEAEDVVQETYVRIAPALERCERLAQPKALLLKVATGIIIDAARRRSLHDGWERGEQILGVEEAVPGEQDEALLCKEIVLSLSPKLREVFLLSRFGGLSNAAIAERLDLPLKTVEWRMSRALAQCSALMRE